MTERKGKNITYASRHMSTLWNPFSYKNTEPKYPDGLAQYSIGQKYTNHFVVEGEETLLVLYPGLVGSVVSFTGEGNNPVVNGIALHADNGNIYERVIKVSTNEKGDAVTNMITLNPDPKFSSWRPVSYAIKIQPVSNHQAIEFGKDGWWEAIRLSNGINFVEWGVHGFGQNSVPYDGTQAEPLRGFGERYSTPKERFESGGALATPELPNRNNPQWINGKGFLQPNNEAIEQFSTSDNWTLQPSYTRGCIKDLQCWTFQLNNIRRDNQFIDLRGVSIAPLAFTGTVSPYITTNVTFRLPMETYYDANSKANYEGKITSVVRDAVNFNIPQKQIKGVSDLDLTHLATIEGFDSLHSDAFDAIVIKLHGRTGTRYLVQCVANIEYLAFNESSLAEYTTTSYAALDELSHYLDVRANEYKFPNHNYFKDKISI